jgi:hypothetical protein
MDTKRTTGSGSNGGNEPQRERTNRRNEGNREGEGLATAHETGLNDACRLGPRQVFLCSFLIFFFRLTYVLIYYRFYLCYNNTTIHDLAIYHRCDPLLAGWLGGAMGWDDDTTRTQIARNGRLTTRPQASRATARGVVGGMMTTTGDREWVR